MDIKLRKLQDSDKEMYIKLSKEIWINKKALQDEERNDRFWKCIMFSNTEVHYAILGENQICGFASVMKLDKEVQELGVELFEKFHHQGIGYKAVVKLLEVCKSEYHMQNIQSKVYADNYPSILLMRKLGGVPCKIVRNACIDESFELDFQRKNEELISENVREMARLFCVEPELLLSNLLVFQIAIPIREKQFDVVLSGDLCYEKKIESQSLKHMYSESLRLLESLVVKSKNSTKEEISDELSAMIEKMESNL